MTKKFLVTLECDEIGMMLANAGLLDAAFGQAILWFALLGLGTVIGIIGLVYGLKRQDRSRAGAIISGLISIGAAALGVWLWLDSNNTGLEGFFAGVIRMPSRGFIVGAPLLMGILSIAAGIPAGVPKGRSSIGRS